VSFQRKPPKNKKPKDRTPLAAKAPVQCAGRNVEARKARKVLRALERARQEAEAAGADLSAWENEFLGSVEAKIGKYGSAFCDPHKGSLEEPISNMQRVKLKEIQAKAAGKEKKPGFGMRRKAPKDAGRAVDFSEED
jgi:hypothetical protein